MKQPKHIQLYIAEPCHADWQQMTPEAKGRHCGQCEKTVIDFSTLSDRALFNYFSVPQGHVCGRFTVGQLKRQIHISPQPKSRLYRIAIACGLTLMFGQAPDAHARVKQPFELLSGSYHDDGKDGSNKDKGTISGQVLDKYGNAASNAVVYISAKGMKPRQSTTGPDGHYSFTDLEPGRYKVTATYLRKKTNADVDVAKEQIQNVTLTVPVSNGPIEPMVMGGLGVVTDVQPIPAAETDKEAPIQGNMQAK